MSTHRTVLSQRLKSFEAACRDKGYKVTPQRLEIYRALAGSVKHPSAEAIYRQVRKRMPTITLDTVYRTMATLEKMGLVERVSAVEGVQRFEANTDSHHHFICQACGAISDLESPKLNRARLQEALPAGYTVLRAEVQLRGICPDCSVQDGPGRAKWT